jgi:hypothetical protein
MNYLPNSEENRFIISRELASEFETVYDFKERISRVQNQNIVEIVNKFNVETDIAKAIYIISLDGKMTEKEAYDYILWVRKLFEKKGLAIPNIPTYILNFAAREGTWLYFLYGKYPHNLMEKTREILNLESGVFKEISQPIERVVNIINARERIITSYIGPILEKWLNEHENLKLIDAIRAIMAPILKVKPEKVDPFLITARRKTRKLFFFLDQLLEKDELVEEGVITKKTILGIRKDLLSNIEQIDIRTMSQILLNTIPRKEVEPDPNSKSSILVVSSPVTRNGLVGPILKSPYDFLERDLKIARMRVKEERKSFVETRLRKIYNSLSQKINDPHKIASRIIINMRSRFDLKSVNPYTVDSMLYEKIMGREKFNELILSVRNKIKEQGKTKVLKKEIMDRIKIRHPISRQDIIKFLTDYFCERFYEECWD